VWRQKHVWRFWVKIRWEQWCFWTSWGSDAGPSTKTSAMSRCYVIVVVLRSTSWIDHLISNGAIIYSISVHEMPRDGLEWDSGSSGSYRGIREPRDLVGASQDQRNSVWEGLRTMLPHKDQFLSPAVHSFSLRRFQWPTQVVFFPYTFPSRAFFSSKRSP